MVQAADDHIPGIVARLASRRSTARSATRKTTLNSAPPLAKLLTSAIGPGASTASARESQRGGRRIRLRQAGDRRHAAGARRTETPPRTRRSPDAPNSPSAPFTDVTTVRAAAEQLTSARPPRPRRASAWHSPTRRRRRPRPVSSPASSSASRIVRTSGSGRSGHALIGTAALDAATPRISPCTAARRRSVAALPATGRTRLRRARSRRARRRTARAARRTPRRGDMTAKRSCAL